MFIVIGNVVSIGQSSRGIISLKLKKVFFCLFVFCFFGVTICSLPHLKCIRFPCAQVTSHLQCIRLVFVRSSLSCINIGVQIELTFFYRYLRNG